MADEQGETGVFPQKSPGWAVFSPHSNNVDMCVHLVHPMDPRRGPGQVAGQPYKADRLQDCDGPPTNPIPGRGQNRQELISEGIGKLSEPGAEVLRDELTVPLVREFALAPAFRRMI